MKNVYLIDPDSEISSVFCFRESIKLEVKFENPFLTDDRPIIFSDFGDSALAGDTRSIEI